MKKQGSVQRSRMVRFCRHKFPCDYKYMGGCTFRISPLLHNGSEITGRRRNKKTLQTPKKGLQRCFLASQRGFEPPAPRLGVITFGSYRVVRRASKCPQTRMNTGFFIEPPVAGYSAVLPDIGKFGAKIGVAIRQILDRIVVDDRRFKGALEQFNSEI